MVRHKAQNVSAKPRTDDIQISEDTDFKSMLLPQPILNGLHKSGYIKPSPIQKKALPLVRCGLDLIVQAKAGTGKTCVFTVAVLELVKPSLPHLQAIVLAPTREIALQITSVIKAIGQCVEGLKVECFIGGYPLSVDVDKVKGCHVAVAAPGRLKHLLDKGLLNSRHVRLFVLDEADKLMEEVFIKDIDAIFAQLPESKQVLACSATYTEQLVEFLSNYMNSGQYVSPHQGVGSSVLLGVRQFVTVIPKHVDRLAQLKLKEKHLLYLLRSVSFNQCLIFSNLHTRAVSLCSLLRTEGWGVEWIAGRQDQKDRVAALASLRDQRVRVLVTTDLTARGVDVENVNLVVNLDVPMDHHTYLHRMGRAGRYGSHGIVITVVSDGPELTAFQKLIGMIGGSDQSVSRIPQSLKNIDLWTMSDDKFEKICGIVETEVLSAEGSEKTGESSTSSEEKYSAESSDSEDSVKHTSSGEKYSPESSDGEDYVEPYKGDSVDSEDYIKLYKKERNESEDNVKECKGRNGVEKANSANPVENVFNLVSGEYLKEVEDFKRRNDFVPNLIETSAQAQDGSNSTDEKFSPDSSDDEADLTSCVCCLYEADSADIKVIAGPSLFALKKEDHWREVLPVVVNESKVPLNTPIALLDSKLIRVRFWDKTQPKKESIQVDSSFEETISFDSKREDKELLSFKDIEKFLECGIKTEDLVESTLKNADRQLLSFENIEEILENGFCEVDSNDEKYKKIEQILHKYRVIKEIAENSLISFDSFDLVGWLAVDELHNIIEEINIDKCDVFMFNLVTCLAGKNHIEVLCPSKGFSKEAEDYIDHITTLNVEKFSIQTPYSLSNIAQQMEKLTTKSSDGIEISDNSQNSKRHGDYKSLGTNVDSSVNNSLKVPIVSRKKSKCVSRKNLGKCDPVNTEGKCDSSSSFTAITPRANKKNNLTNLSHTRPQSNNENEGKGLAKSLHTSYKVNKCDKKLKSNSENKSKSSQSTVARNFDKQASRSSNDSGPYVEMGWKNTSDKQQSQLSHNKNQYHYQYLLQENLGVKPKTQDHIESKSLGKDKPLNGFGHSNKHRGSDDSYDSFDSVEYETTDLDKKNYQETCNVNGMQIKHHTAQQDFNDKSHHSKFTKPKVLYSKNERSKTHDHRYKHTHLEFQDTFSSIEFEATKHVDFPLKVPSRRDLRSKKNLHEGRSKQLNNDTEESYKDSSENNRSVETEISKLGELNSQLRSQDRKNKHHNTQRHKRFHHESADDHSSVESCGTNYHSFRTACSQHSDEEYIQGATSNRSRRLSNPRFEDRIPVQTDQSANIRYLHKRDAGHKGCHRHEGREETEYIQQEFSEKVNSQAYESYGSYYDGQFETYQDEFFQYQQQDMNAMGRGESQVIKGKNLHEEWYKNWYLRVRQRAMHLAMTEYVNSMSHL